MNFTQTRYKAFDILKIPFQASALLMTLQILSTIIQALLPTALLAITTANFVDTAISILSNNRERGDIYFPLFLLLVVAGINSVIASFSKLITAKLSFELERKLKPAFISTRAGLSFKHIEDAKSWELINRVANDPVKAFQNGITAYMSMLRNVITIVSILGLIVMQIWWAAAVILAFSVPLLWFALRAGKKNYAAQVDTRKYVRRHEYYRDLLINREAVEERSLFGYGEHLTTKYFEQYEIARKHQLIVGMKQFIVIKSVSIAMSLIALFIALILINPVITGTLSAGMFMGIVAAVFGMINRLGWSLQSATQKISQANEYMKDLTLFVNMSQSKGALDLPDNVAPVFESLELRNVRFKYPTGERNILDGLSLKIEAGRNYSFVGANGAGKTTITKLLTGLYDEYEGEIFINGKELRTLPASTVKAFFAVVYQDFARYQIPLKDNILVGNVTNPNADISQYINLAGLEETVAELKNGADTPLGKVMGDGVDISGGQWQRVAIARSLASHAPVKILDEPTAALDPISESRIYQEFEKLMQGKTTIFISHRLGSTKLSDEILVFDGGHVAECGTHEDLMKKKGLYAEMYEAQRSWYE